MHRLPSELGGQVFWGPVNGPLQTEQDDGQPLAHFVVQFLRDPAALGFLGRQGSGIVQSSLGFQSGQHGVECLHQLAYGSVARFRQSLAGKLQVDMLHHFYQSIQGRQAPPQQ